MNSLVGRIVLACSISWLAACNGASPRRSVDVSAVQGDVTCSGACDDSRVTCNSVCRATDCTAACESAWEGCRTDCPDGSVEPEHVTPITVIGVAPAQSGPGNLNTAPVYPDAGVLDAGQGVNGINLTGAGGVNGINLTGAGGINGISVTAVGGSSH